MPSCFAFIKPLVRQRLLDRHSDGAAKASYKDSEIGGNEIGNQKTDVRNETAMF